MKFLKSYIVLILIIAIGQCKNHRHKRTKKYIGHPIVHDMVSAGHSPYHNANQIGDRIVPIEEVHHIHHADFVPGVEFENHHLPLQVLSEQPQDQLNVIHHEQLIEEPVDDMSAIHVQQEVYPDEVHVDQSYPVHQVVGHPAVVHNSNAPFGVPMQETKVSTLIPYQPPIRSSASGMFLTGEEIHVTEQNQLFHDDASDYHEAATDHLIQHADRISEGHIVHTPHPLLAKPKTQHLEPEPVLAVSNHVMLHELHPTGAHHVVHSVGLHPIENEPIHVAPKGVARVHTVHYDGGIRVGRSITDVVETDMGHHHEGVYHRRKRMLRRN